MRKKELIALVTDLILRQNYLRQKNNTLKQGTSMTNLKSDMAELKEQLCHISKITKEMSTFINITPSNTSWVKLAKNRTNVNNGKDATISEII